MVLGMIPDCDLAKVTGAGNAAGTGARIALLNRAVARRDRARGEAGREDRDRGRAEVPGAFRRRDGDPAQDRALSASRQGGESPGAQSRRTGRMKATAEARRDAAVRARYGNKFLSQPRHAACVLAVCAMIPVNHIFAG